MASVFTANQRGLGIDVPISSNINIGSNVDFRAIQDFINKKTDSISRKDFASLHTADDSAGIRASRYTSGKFTEDGLAGYLTSGRFNLNGGVKKRQYDGNSTGSSKFIEGGYRTKGGSNLSLSVEKQNDANPMFTFRVNKPF